jgi:hypothetical protein
MFLSDSFDPVHPSRDPSTYANTDNIVTNHFHLDLYVDFNNQSLYGTNAMTFTALTDISQVVIDYRGLNIYSVVDADDKPMNYQLMTPNTDIGSCIIVYFQCTAPLLRFVFILYNSNWNGRHYIH